MPIHEEPFDCSKTLRTWKHDPDQTPATNMLSLIECYSRDFRRMVCEIGRLEGLTSGSAKPPRRAKESDYSEIQKLIDDQIASLDPDRE